MPRPAHPDPDLLAAAAWRAMPRRVALAAALLAALCAPALASDRDPAGYVVTPLVSNGSVPTPYVDPNMVNTWGVSFNPVGLVWVTNNRTGTSTLYDGFGAVNPLVVVVPPAGRRGTGSPTGIVFSGTADFRVSNGTTAGPSRFIFASDDGLISGWAPNVDLHNAIRAAITTGADYTGLAIAHSSTGARLYAADVKNGRVDMFDSEFRKLEAPGAFVDPTLPSNLKPFGIQEIGNQVYVTYTKQWGSGGSGSSGSGGSGSSGGSVDSAVSVFDADGRFVRRAIARSTLKQPWGLAVAPANFGKYSNRLLVGDFHDGTITAYDNNGALLGTLNDTRGQPLRIPGLWGFQFGNGVNNQPTNALFYGAGPNGMGGGVYGSVTAGPR